MVKIEKDKLVIEIPTISPLEELQDLSQAIFGILEEITKLPSDEQPFNMEFHKFKMINLASMLTKFSEIKGLENSEEFKRWNKSEIEQTEA